MNVSYKNAEGLALAGVSPTHLGICKIIDVPAPIESFYFGVISDIRNIFGNRTDIKNRGCQRRSDYTPAPAQYCLATRPGYEFLLINEHINLRRAGREWRLMFATAADAAIWYTALTGVSPTSHNLSEDCATSA